MKTNAHHDFGQKGVVVKVLLVFLAAFVCLMVVAGMVVASSVRPDGAFRGLSADILDTLGGPPQAKVQFKVPALVFTTARIATRFMDVEPEIKSGLHVVRSLQVGVYQLGEEPGRKGMIKLTRVADQSMAALGWDRIVQVVDEEETVLVYGSPTGIHGDEVESCVIVLAGHELVVVTARGRLQPIIQMALHEF